MSSLEVVKGDITRLDTDAIVNAANAYLRGGGGVDGAIHKAGGPQILEECRRIVDRLGPLPVGDAVITGGGRLPARYVVHTVGPMWQGGGNGEPHQLARCYFNCLRLAHQNGIRTIGFPCISTGVYGYPQAKAAEVALKTVSNYVDEHPEHFDRIVFCCFEEIDFGLYRQMLGAEEVAD